MSFSGWMDGVVHPNNGILFSNKKKWATRPSKDIKETYMHISNWKKPIWRGYILYDFCNKCTSVVGMSIHKVGKSVHVLGQEVYGNSVFSSQLCYGPKTALRNVYLKNKVDPGDKIKSDKTVPGFKISILHNETGRASVQWHLRLQDFSTQSTKTNLWWVVGFFPAWLTIYRAWITGVWVESQLCKVSCFPHLWRLNDITYVKQRAL